MLARKTRKAERDGGVGHRGKTGNAIAAPTGKKGRAFVGVSCGDGDIDRFDYTAMENSLIVPSETVPPRSWPVVILTTTWPKDCEGWLRSLGRRCLSAVRVLDVTDGG